MTEITDIVWEDEEHTRLSAALDGETTWGIHAGSWQWPLIMEAVSNGAPMQMWEPSPESPPVPTPGGLKATKDRADDPDKRVYVLHTPGTDKYHRDGDDPCPRPGASAVRITLWKAKKQVGSRPAKCCLKDRV